MSDKKDQKDEPIGLRLYRAASKAAAPVADVALHRRLQQGKEDPERVAEKRGAPSVARPEGPLVWLHGASVGESLSVLPLVEHFSALRPDLSFLVTTGTVTSASLLADRLPSRAVHQYAPLDHPDYVGAFLAHWRPSAALFVESEFWPNLIREARATTPFMAVINGRMSPQSHEKWRRNPRTIGFLLRQFDVLTAQDHQNRERFAELSGREVHCFGNLKYAAPALACDQEALDGLAAAFGERRRWLAASTHEGEEDVALSVHKRLSSTIPDILTIIAPRHPERGEAVAALAAEAGLRTARRSLGELPDAETDIYIADTMGELGLFYRLCDISFVGGSLTPKGGHNPLEPARLGGAILHGPYTFNFVETYSLLRQRGGSALVRNERELATAASRLLSDARTRTAMSMSAQRSAETAAARVLQSIAGLVIDHLPAKTLAAE